MNAAAELDIGGDDTGADGFELGNTTAAADGVAQIDGGDADFEAAAAWAEGEIELDFMMGLMGDPLLTLISGIPEVLEVVVVVGLVLVNRASFSAGDAGFWDQMSRSAESAACWL